MHDGEMGSKGTWGGSKTFMWCEPTVLVPVRRYKGRDLHLELPPEGKPGGCGLGSAIGRRQKHFQ